MTTAPADARETVPLQAAENLHHVRRAAASDLDKYTQVVNDAHDRGIRPLQGIRTLHTEALAVESIWRTVEEAAGPDPDPETLRAAVVSIRADLARKLVTDLADGLPDHHASRTDLLDDLRAAAVFIRDTDLFDPARRWHYPPAPAAAEVRDTSHGYTAVAELLDRRAAELRAINDHESVLVQADLEKAAHLLEEAAGLVLVLDENEDSALAQALTKVLFAERLVTNCPGMTGTRYLGVLVNALATVRARRADAADTDPQ